MKIKILTGLLIVSVLTGAFAQDSTRVPIKEIYLTLANVNPINIGIKYKTQIREKTFFKVGLVDLSFNRSYSGINITSGISVENSNYTGGLLLGLEFRKKINNKVTFYHGPNIGFSINDATSRRIEHYSPFSQSFSNISNFTASLPYTFGGLFNLSGHFYLSAEINPVVSYSSSSNGNGNSIQVAIANNFGLVSLVYRL